MGCALGGCAAPAGPPTVRPNLAPTTQPTASLQIAEPVRPMYQRLLAIDLATAVRVAAARNLDIRLARERVNASQGRLESSVGSIFPVIAPGIAFAHLEGANQASGGNLVFTNFNTLLPSVLIQTVLNPGAVVYDVIASRKRLAASEQQEQSVRLETTRLSAIQYFDLVLAQTKVGATRRALNDAQELLRITQLRVKAGAGLHADELRAQASLASRQQDLTSAMNLFYQASVTLSLTLHLDPSVTLAPAPREVRQTTLVREDMSIENLLALAVQWRPDLGALRSAVAAAQADQGVTAFTGLGPQFQGSYRGGILSADSPGKKPDTTLYQPFHETQRAGAGVGFSLGLSTFGQFKTGKALERAAEIDVQRRLDKVRADVIRAAQDSNANAALIPAAQREVTAAAEALRLAQTNFGAGTMLLIDVLQAEDAVEESRLRYATAVARYNQSQINLLASLGLLDEKSLLQ
ncbi:MAG TPA: TolC family protein [Tepidisphaeraceae bacterium]|nr:TolC family protein [Tepidisphaeraceae bacterium]